MVIREEIAERDVNGRQADEHFSSIARTKLAQGADGIARRGTRPLNHGRCQHIAVLGRDGEASRPDANSSDKEQRDDHEPAAKLHGIHPLKSAPDASGIARGQPASDDTRRRENPSLTC
jgi:hypothetical protein